MREVKRREESESCPSLKRSRGAVVHDGFWPRSTSTNDVGVKRRLSPQGGRIESLIIGSTLSSQEMYYLLSDLSALCI